MCVNPNTQSHSQFCLMIGLLHDLHFRQGQEIPCERLAAKGAKRQRWQTEASSLKHSGIRVRGQESSLLPLASDGSHGV